MKNVAIIGCGLQAKRRLPSILEDPDTKVLLSVDKDEKKAISFSKLAGGEFSTDWLNAVQDPRIDIVLVLTYPDSHAAISIAAMEHGKDVLCEKPLARSSLECEQMIEAKSKFNRILKCGFNHRYHPAIAKARELFLSGAIGMPVFGRAKYGIQGREGLEREWRSNPEYVSGGQLMEQGIHLIDLFRYFLGDIKEVMALIETRVFPISPFEDNAFVLMKTDSLVPISIHTSLTQWINLFEFEVYGELGSLTVEGMGESYGTETLKICKLDTKGPFAHEVIEFRGKDISWREEWRIFKNAITSRYLIDGDGLDGLKAINVVESAYLSSRAKRYISL